MATKRPDFDAAMSRVTANKGSSVHPLISAIQFANQTDAEGGASMHAVSGRIYKPQDGGYFVGGHPAAKGEAHEDGKVPAVKQPTAPTRIGDVLNQRQRVLQGSDKPERVALGVWNNPEDGHSHWDATTVFRDRRSAVRAGKARDQISVWDNARSEEIPTGGTGGAKPDTSKGAPARGLAPTRRDATWGTRDPDATRRQTAISRSNKRDGYWNTSLPAATAMKVLQHNIAKGK